MPKNGHSNTISPVLLQAVLKTETLSLRGGRSPDHAAENRVLVELCQAMTREPETLLQRLADAALKLCRADSAGVCILESQGGQESFRWRGVSGRLAAIAEFEMPRSNSPCGLVIDRDTPQLFAYPERYYGEAVIDGHPIVEALLVPFHEQGKPIGALWVVAHSPERQFDLEDQRVLTDLSKVVSAAWQVSMAVRKTDSDVEAIGRLHQLRTMPDDGKRLDRLLDEILAAAIAIGGADFGNIRLLDAGSNELKIVAQRGFEPWWIDYWNSVTTGQGACGTALGRGERLIVEDIRQSPIFAEPGCLDVQLRAGFLAVQSTPLVSRSGKVLGMFSTHYRKPGRPDDRALKLLDLFASEAAELLYHHQTELAMREFEDRFRLLVETTSAVHWTTDAEGNQIKDLSSWQSFSGQTEEELRFRGWTSAIHPDDLVSALQKWDDAIRSGTPFMNELRLRRHDGQWRWMSVHTVPVLDAVGRVVEWVGMNFDITEQKLAQDAIRESQSKLKAAIESMSDAIFISDVEGRLVDVNEAFVTFHRFASREACLKAIADYAGIFEAYFPDGTPVPLEEWGVSRALRGESAMEAEYHIRRKDTGERWIGSFNFAPIRDAKGEIVGAVVVGRDITQR